MDIFDRLYHLLDLSLAFYLPDNGDIVPEYEEEVSDLRYMAMVINKLCHEEETFKKRLRQKIVPDDLDRSSQLNERSDMLGRCLRVMQGTIARSLSPSIGEMLYTMADSNRKS